MAKIGMRERTAPASENDGDEGLARLFYDQWNDVCQGLLMILLLSGSLATGLPAGGREKKQAYIIAENQHLKPECCMLPRGAER